MSDYEMLVFRKIDKGIIKDTWVVTGSFAPVSLDWVTGLLRAFVNKPVGFQYEYRGIIPPGNIQAPVVLDVYVPVVDARLFGRGGPPCDMADETDPLDDLLEAAGVGKEAGLGLPKHRTYIYRTMEFEESQKRSREKIAEAMSDGDTWTEDRLNRRCDPRRDGGVTAAPNPGAYMYLAGIDFDDNDDEEEKSD